MSKISDAINAKKLVERENAERLAEADQAIVAAVSEDFKSGAKVKLEDKFKDGKPVIGATYTVISVIDGGDVLVKGKGVSKKVFPYTKLELI